MQTDLKKKNMFASSDLFKWKCKIGRDSKSLMVILLSERKERKNTCFLLKKMGILSK